MPGLSELAQAFEDDSNGGGARETSGLETVFGRMGELEVDENSPAQGGGDNEPIKAKGIVVEEDDDGEKDPEDALYDEVPANKSKEPPEDPDEDDEPEEDDEDDEPEEDDEDEDEGEGEDDGETFVIPDKAKIKVTIDGKDTIVTGREAKEGYIRLQTFHQRLNKVNEASDAVRTEAGKVIARQQEAIAYIDELKEDLETLLPPEPDWDGLYAQNPTSARKLQKDYGALKGKLEDLNKKRQKLVNDTNQAVVDQITTFARSEAEKFDALNPTWLSNPDRKTKDMQAMIRTAKSLGFTEKELDSTYDSRMLMVLLKASKYDRMIASRPKPAKRGASKPVAPGSGSRGRTTTKTGARGLQRAQEQLAKTGSVDAAANVFQHLLRR